MAIFQTFLATKGIESTKHINTIARTPFLKQILLQIIISVVVGLLGHIIKSSYEYFFKKNDTTIAVINLQGKEINQIECENQI